MPSASRPFAAATRADVARATGFVHAQDRFFQMDLARRRAAGELAALVGPRALALDREIRIHRFRAEAQRAFALLSSGDRALLDAYTAGVNSGLGALDGAPVRVPGAAPGPGRRGGRGQPAGVLSMFVTLQDTDGSYESTLARCTTCCRSRCSTFWRRAGSEWDTPVVGDAFTMPPIPGPDVYDLRTRRQGKPAPPSTANTALPNA